MADERDPKVSQRYRELGSEEPPPALDRAIVAASRRAAAPRRRWYLPLAAAAAAVLAVGVALHVQREQPDMEAVTTPAEVKEAPSEAKQESPPASQSESTQRLRKEQALPDLGRQAPAQDEPRSDEPARAAREFRLEDQAPAKPSAPAPQAAPGPAAGAIAGRVMQQTPEQWLSQIAEIRSKGQHEEADKALAEFRRRYPDYRISQEMLDKVERK